MADKTDKSHDCCIKSNAAAMPAVRNAQLGGAKKLEPQFGITKLDKFGITHTMRKTVRNP